MKMIFDKLGRLEGADKGLATGCGCERTEDAADRPV
jgi:hypothetical protein